MVNFLTAEIALLEKKKANRKPSKTQEANVAVKAEIVNYLTNYSNDKFRASEVGEAVKISPNKASALLRQLVLTGEVERIEEKRVAYFQIATTDEETE